MALSRWTHSDFYIYETMEEENIPSLSICGVGTYSLSELNLFPDKVKVDLIALGYPTIAIIEALLYIKIWNKFMLKTISYRSYLRIIELLRFYGFLRTFIRYPDLYDRNTLMRSFNNVIFRLRF